MPDHALAYFLTIRTYGTWLSGDARGSVDDEHRAFGEPFRLRDDLRNQYQQRLMKGQAARISPAMRTVIEAEVQRTCAYRAWELYAVNVRTNHVHLVVGAEPPPEDVMRELKVYATRALRRAGLLGRQAPMWSAHGSTRYAWDEDDAETCIAYTLDAQGDDLPGSGWRAARDGRDTGARSHRP